MASQEALVVDNLYVKIERASSLLASLERESTAFLAENYRVEGRLNQKTRKYSFLALGNPVVPPRFSILIGEIVYHLRTVLDHLIFILAGGQGKPTKLSFPIGCKEGEFKSALKRGILKGVPDRAVQVIEHLQPYRTSPNPRAATLYQLHNLNIIDKHRLLVAAAACADMRSGGTFLVDAKEDATLVLPRPDEIPASTRPSKGGQVIFEFEFANPPRPDAIIRAVDVFDFKIKFDRAEAVMQNREVLSTLVIMRDTVTSVVDELCRVDSGGRISH